MNQMPNQISDWDLMHNTLILHKHEIGSLAHCLSETSNPQLRQDYLQSLQTVLGHHQQLSQLMDQRGYYKAIPAGQQEMQAAAQQVQNALAQLGGPGAPPPQAPGAGPQYQTRT